jgi:CheY-like chemotaxis protein
MFKLECDSTNHAYCFDKEDCNQEPIKKPKLSNSLPLQSKDLIIKTKKIILVDDIKLNLVAFKRSIKKYFPQIFCDVALDASTALEMIKSNKYDLIITDIQMPERSGIWLAKQIRIFDKKLPIIATTSLDPDSLIAEIVEETRGNIIKTRDKCVYFNKCIAKLSSLLYRTIANIIGYFTDDLLYFTKADIENTIEDQNIILVGDKIYNLEAIKMLLTSYGAKITIAKNGLELLKFYKDSIDKSGISFFDIIITDINMGGSDNKFLNKNGDYAASEIRRIERSNSKLRFKTITDCVSLNTIAIIQEIPIIALNGNEKEEYITRLFNFGINDYFIKSRDLDFLARTVAINLNKRKIKTRSNITMEQKITKEQQNNQPKNIIDDLSFLSLPILNLALLKSFDTKTQNDINKLSVVELDEIINTIKLAKQNDDLVQISFLLHKVKGIATTIGAQRLLHCVVEI